MSYEFYMLWNGASGTKCWSGPHDTIDDAKRSVPDTAVAQMLVTPLIAMTPAEAKLARPIREGATP